MIESNDYFLSISKIESIYFEEFLTSIKAKNKILKQNFFSENFVDVFHFRKSCYSTFFIQFIPYLDLLTYSKNDKKIISRLKELGFNDFTIKYMSDIDEVAMEIIKLEKINGQQILPYHFLFACNYYLTSKFKIEAFESIFGTIDYNGIDSNSLFLDNFKRNRRSKPVNDNTVFDFENLMIEVKSIRDNFLNNYYGEAISLDKELLKIYKGNSNVVLDLFNVYYIKKSKSEVYDSIFPLFKLIFKDRKLLCEGDFINYCKKLHKINGVEYYENNYRKYKTSKVRDIFKLK